jgi:hypothetical protein
MAYRRRQGVVAFQVMAQAVAARSKNQAVAVAQAMSSLARWRVPVRAVVLVRAVRPVTGLWAQAG